MSRFLMMSDLHLEFAGLDMPVPSCLPGGDAAAPARGDIDGILLAGDVAARGNHVDAMLLLWDLWRCPVVMVYGNHEFYGRHRLQKVKELASERIAEMNAAGADLQILDRGTRVIGDTRIIGATLWTDTEIWPEIKDTARFSVERRMNDYRKVSVFDERKRVFRRLTIGDTLEMHREDKAYILRQAKKPFDGKTLVMTHHVPAVQALSAAEINKRSVSSAGYASDLWSEISPLAIDAWVSGHVHRGRCVVMPGEQGDVAFVSNMRGYPGEETSFNPMMTIDSKDFSAGIDAYQAECSADSAFEME